MEPIHFFRAGTHTCSDGRELTFSDADLAAIAEGYQPAIHEAPIVIGHPEHDAPAYGWVERVEARPGGLYAIPREVSPVLAHLVLNGAYNKVSAALYMPETANNPIPGNYYLRHIGFLGALSPVIKGLEPVMFTEPSYNSDIMKARVFDFLGLHNLKKNASN